MQGHRGSVGVAQAAALQLARALHGEVVAEDRAGKAQPSAQDVLQPACREPGRARVHFGVHHMGRHHGGQARGQPIVRPRIVFQDRLERSAVHWHVYMAVGRHIAVAREMLAAVRHARTQQAVHHALGQQRHHPGVAVEGAVADHAAGPVVQIEHGREAQVHAAGAQLGAQHIAHGRGRVRGRHRVAHPLLTQPAHGRQVREAVGAKALHAPTFMVHADQQVRPDRLGLSHQRGQLAPVNPMPGEQDHAAGQGVGQAPAVLPVQRGAGDVQHHGGLQAGRCNHGLTPRSRRPRRPPRIRIRRSR